MNLELSLSRVAISLIMCFCPIPGRSYCTGVMRSPLGVGGAVGAGGGGGGGEAVVAEMW